MFSLFAPRDCNQAIAFLEHFRTSLFPWTLIATGRGRAQVVTFTPQLHGAAADWIMKMQRQSRNVLLLMAETHGSVTGVQLVRGHLRGTRHFGVKLLLSQTEALEKFTPKPFLRLEAGDRLYAAWRFINEVPIERAEALATTVAARLGGVSLGHMTPLPGLIHEDAKVELAHLYKDRLNVLTDFSKPAETTLEAATPPSFFTAASTITAEPESWLWPGVVPSGALTLLSGQPKAGKTQITLDAAARISAGLPWPTGETSEAGRVAVFELEDKAESSIVPRLTAMGADIRNVVVRDAKDGPLNLAEDMGKVAASLDQLGGVRLLTLSPLLAFFGQAATDDAEVRRRLRPLLEWAATNGTAVIGVLHPPKRSGQSLEAQFAGADTYRRAARAAWVVAPDATDKEPDVKRKRRALMCAGINGAADDLRLFFRIKGVEVDGIETSRIVWQRIDEPDADKPSAPTEPSPIIRDETKPTSVDAWLREALRPGPRNAAELKAEAQASGFSVRTLYRAVKRLGVESSSGGFGQPRVWRLQREKTHADG
jgi:putative DNA primase/helicase